MEEGKLTLDLNTYSNVKRFMNLEFVFEKKDQSEEYNLIVIEGKNKYKYEPTTALTLNNDFNKIDQFVDFLQTEFFIPQVNLEATFKAYNQEVNLKKAMKYNPKPPQSKEIEILLKKIDTDSDAQNDCKNLEEFFDDNLDSKSIKFTKLDESNADESSTDSPAFNFLEFKKEILEKLKENDSNNKYQNMIISIHRICDLSELEKLLHKYFSCFDFTIVSISDIDINKQALIDKIKTKYEESMEEKMRKDDELIEQLKRNQPQDPNIISYLNELENLKSGESSRSLSFVEPSPSAPPSSQTSHPNIAEAPTSVSPQNTAVTPVQSSALPSALSPTPVSPQNTALPQSQPPQTDLISNTKSEMTDQEFKEIKEFLNSLLK
jgi:hypothetical protein